MAESIQEFRYLNEIEVKQLFEAEGGWQCTTCFDSDMESPLVSHCGIMHASHRDCEMIWLKEHDACSICRQPVGWSAILTWSESFFASLPVRVGVKIGTTVYHQIRSSPNWRLFYTATLLSLDGYFQEIPVVQSMGAFAFMRTFGNLADESSEKLEKFADDQQKLQGRIKELKNTENSWETQLKILKEKSVKPNRKGRKLQRQIEEKENQLPLIRSELLRMQRIYQEQRKIETYLWFAHKAQYMAQGVGCIAGLYYFYCKSF